MNNRHIIQIYLEYVSFPFTRSKLKELILNNPLSDTFWGIKHILKEYNIDSIGFRMDETDILSLTPPFIVQLKNQDESYALLTKIDHLGVEYLTPKSACRKTSLIEFQSDWTGMILYPEITLDSKEKNLRLNKVIGSFNSIRIPIIIFASFLLILLLAVKNSMVVNAVNVAVVICYISGILTCVGLLIQEIDKNNPFIKKICKTYKKADCVGVMESKASKFLGLIGWSEIGFIFFLGSLFVFILLPSYRCLLFWVHTFTLPYTIWSVVYQWKVVKVWCTLCLYVQFILWLIFIFFLFGKAYSYPLEFHFDIIIDFMACYVLPAICLWFVFPFIKQAHQFPFVSYQLNKIKSNENLFYHLLNDQKILTLEPSARKVVFGNANASFTLTVINNPYCQHCANMHKRIIPLLQKYRNQIKIEIVFVGDEYSQETIRFLIAAYCQYGQEVAEIIYSDWFEKKEATITEKYPVYDQNIISYANTIYTNQKKWRESQEKVSTPSIYVNDRELPEEYRLEDIIYFI